MAQFLCIGLNKPCTNLPFGDCAMYFDPKVRFWWCFFKRQRTKGPNDVTFKTHFFWKEAVIYTPLKSNIDTQNWHVYQGIYLFQAIILGFHVSSQGCNQLVFFCHPLFCKKNILVVKNLGYSESPSCMEYTIIKNCSNHLAGFSIYLGLRDALPSREDTFSLRTCGCFLKWWCPQIIHFNRVFHYKPSILGYPYFGNTHVLCNKKLEVVWS